MVALENIAYMPEFQFHPFTQRIIDLIRQDLRKDRITKEEFIQAMSIFGEGVDLDKKKYFLFRIYDKDGSGTLTPDEFKVIFQTFLFPREHFRYGEAFNPEKTRSVFTDKVCDEILRVILDRFDSDGNGVISYDEFAEAVTDSDIQLCLSIPFN